MSTEKLRKGVELILKIARNDELRKTCDAALIADTDEALVIALDAAYKKQEGENIYVGIIAHYALDEKITA